MNPERNPFAASIDEILVSGSDARLLVDAVTGLNSVGCSRTPRCRALSFGSSTASSISSYAYRRLQEIHSRDIACFDGGEYLNIQTESLRTDLRSLLGLTTSEAEIVFSPSGTDSTLHALYIARALSRAKKRSPLSDAVVTTVLVGSDETGSSVPAALIGCHFNSNTAGGAQVARGDIICGLAEGTSLQSIAIRDENFAVLPRELVDRRVYDKVSESVSQGIHVLLQVMESSKLGARSPSADCLLRIAADFGGNVTIVVDACQMRTGFEDLRMQLKLGRMVLISGSKFFTGPAFSGALLIPPSISSEMKEEQEIAEGLADYSDRNSWPRSWQHIREALPDRINLGQHYRWIAAIEEMRRYFDVPIDFRRTILNSFAEITTRLISEHEGGFHLLEEGNSPDQECLCKRCSCDEMRTRTIFPFLIRRATNSIAYDSSLAIPGWVSVEEAQAVYKALNVDILPRFSSELSSSDRSLATQECHIGQPVVVNIAGSGRTGALRICASARTVSDAWARYQSDSGAIHLGDVRRSIETVLNKASLIIERMPGIGRQVESAGLRAA